MRHFGIPSLPALAALAVLSVAPAVSFAANDTVHNAPRAQAQQDVAAVRQTEQQPQAANGCRPEYQIYSSHVKWLNNCPSTRQAAYQVYDSHVAWQ